MNDVAITFKMTTSYFEESYDETIKYRLKYRKWDSLASSIFVGVALLLFVYSVAIGTSKTGAIIGASLLGYSLFALRKSLTHKKKWMIERMKRGILDQDARIKFTEDHMEHSGPHSTGTMKWSAIQRIDETPKAIYLIVDQGISIFLPKNLFESVEAWQQVLKIAERKHGVEVKSFPPS